MVITADGVYSKHYYAGSQRIVSRLGSSDAGIFETACVGCKPQTTDNELDAKKLQQAQKNDLQGYADKLKRGTIVYKDYKPVPLAVQEKALQEENATMLENPDGTNSTPLQRLGEEEARRVVPIYYYHPDHLGTSTALTDFNGNAYQIFLNLPFGETIAQQLGSNYYNSPHKFNGKELDEETGFYYYGARYYDPRISVWQSVDPLADVPHSIGMSPYCAMANNPINNTDPDGADWVEGKDGGVRWNDNVTAKNHSDKGILGEGETYRGTSYERIKQWDNVKSGEGTTINNMVLEQYGTNKKMTYDEFSSASISVDGAMREGNDKLGDVTIKVTANFKSGASRVMDGGFAGVAGGFGNGAPENGNYTLNSYQDRGPKGWYNKGMTNDGVGFSYNLNPTFSTGRTLLRMHPDGNKEGTLGCIGVSGGASTLLGLSTNINWVLRRQTSIPTVISIMGNPNNNGRSGKKIPNVNE